MDGLFSPLHDWRSQYKDVNETEVVLNPSTPSSCGRLVVKVDRGDHEDDVEVSVRHLAELLRLVELATRPGVDPCVFRDIVAYSDDCLLEQGFCSFCDDVDQRVALKLSPKPATRSNTRQSFTTIVRRAVFDWDEKEASPAFCKLRDWLVARASSAPRSRPVELSADINGDGGDDDETSHRREDEVKLLLERARDERLFRMTALKVVSPSLEMLRLFASSNLAIEVSGVSKLLSAPGAEMEQLPRLPLTKVSGNGDLNPEMLYRCLLANSSQLKSVSVNHTKNDGGTTVRLISRSLFAPDSPIRLESLEVEAHIDEQDLKIMIAELESITSAGSVRSGDDVHHRSFKLATSQLSTIRGETLDKLLTLSGGVESLVLRCCSGDAFAIAEIPHLLASYPSLWSLDVDVTCEGWTSIPLTPVSTTNVVVECLKLRIDEWDPCELIHAVERLLHIVGGSLKSLSVMTTQRSAPLPDTIATVIAHLCPNLEELDFRHIDGDFVSAFVRAYTQQPCKLKRLSFVVSHEKMDCDHLKQCLSRETHPLARTLQSLYIDASTKDAHSVCFLGFKLRGILKTNRKLHDIQLGAPDMWLRNPGETFRGGGWSCQPLSSRRTLAALSGLRRLNLPQEVLQSILMMAARPVVRYRMRVLDNQGDAEDDEDDYDSEDEEEGLDEIMNILFDHAYGRHNVQDLLQGRAFDSEDDSFEDEDESFDEEEEYTDDEEESFDEEEESFDEEEESFDDERELFHEERESIDEEDGSSDGDDDDMRDGKSRDDRECRQSSHLEALEPALAFNHHLTQYE